MKSATLDTLTVKLPPAEVQRHLENLDRFESAARRAGVSVRRGAIDAWARLACEPDDRVRLICRNFGIFTDVCEETLREGKSLHDCRQLVWRMLRHLGLRAASDLYENISPGDVVEIYNRDFIQIFRNFQFFAVSSYTLEELIHFPLYELFERDLLFTAMLREEFSTALGGAGELTIRSRVPRHFTREIFSQDRLTASLQTKVISPLCDAQHAVVGFVAVLDVQIRA